MADVVAKYGVALDDQVSGPAAKAGAGLAELRASIIADTGALRQMQAAMRDLKGSTSADETAIKTLRDKIDASKTSIAAAQANYVKLGGTFEKVAGGAGNVAKAAGGTSTAMLQMTQIASGTGGTFGRVTLHAINLTKGLGGAGLAGAAIAAVAALGLLATVAVVGVIDKMIDAALAAGDAFRDMSVDLQAAAIAGKNFKASGDAMSDTVINIASQVPIARTQVAQFATQLASIKGDNFEKALQAVSTLGSVGGNTGALVAQLKAAAAAGQDISKITSKIEAQYGDLARSKMLDVQTQLAKAKENISALFGGLKIEGLEKAIQSVLSLFSESTTAGKGLKTLITSLLQPLLDTSAKAGPAVVAIFKGAIIWALKAAVGVYLLRNKIADLIGVGKGGSVLQTLFSKLEGPAKLAAIAVGAVVAAILAVVGVLAVGAATVALFTGALVSGVVDMVRFGATLVSSIGGAIKGLAGKVAGFVSAGKDFVLGIAKGIASGAGALFSSIAGLASSAVSKLKSALKISSPSKVLEDQVGIHIPGGVARGVDKGSAQVEKAAARMGGKVAAATAGGALPVVAQGSARGAGAGGVALTVNVTVPAGTPNAQGFGAEVGAAIRRELESTLERAAAQLGAA